MKIELDAYVLPIMVTLRDGTTETIDRNDGSNSWPYTASASGRSWEANGKYYCDGNTNPQDIVSIGKAPTEAMQPMKLTDLKVGMYITDSNDYILKVVSKAPNGDGSIASVNLRTRGFKFGQGVTHTFVRDAALDGHHIISEEEALGLTEPTDLSDQMDKAHLHDELHADKDSEPLYKIHDEIGTLGNPVPYSVVNEIKLPHGGVCGGAQLGLEWPNLNMSPRKRKVEAILAAYKDDVSIELRLTHAIVDMMNEYPGLAEIMKPIVFHSDKEAVDHPDHYNTGSMETIEKIKFALSPEAFMGFLQGNIMKYIDRADHKGKPDEDLAKAAWYRDRFYDENKPS